MQTVAVTRPEPQASGTARRIEARGAIPRRIPLLRAMRLANPHIAAGTAALAFTSRTAPMLLAGRTDLASLPVFAVGARTGEEAERAGFRHVSVAGGDVAALARHVIAAAPDGPVVHVCGDDQRGDLAGALSAAGLSAERCVIYKMAAARALPAGPADCVALYSPRTAAIFARLAAGTAWRGAVCVALSPEVAAPLGRAFAVRTATAPTEDSLLRRLADQG